MRDGRQGCLEGLLQIFLLNAAFDWMQRRYGWGRGASCTGCGCGLILTVVFLFLLCGILVRTDWFSLF